MALAVRNAAALKPEIRLAQAVSEFEAKLDEEHKAAFRNTRIAARTTPPTPSDVMRLTADIDARVRQEHGLSRCFGPRLTNILQAVQQFAALGDTVIGGSQSLVACGVWSAVRMMLHVVIGYASYLEKLSLLFMTAGRQAPRYQALAIIYPQSKTLQSYLSEYFIIIVRICQRIQRYAKKSAFGQFKSSLNDADLKEDQADLEAWGNSIRDEATVLLNERLGIEAQENEKARTWVSWWSTSSLQQQALARKMRWLDECSTYDHQISWKQIRKRGSTSLLSTWNEYQQWKQEVETPSAILVNGKIGAGKSVIMANIVDDLYLAGDRIVVYFFCRHDVPESLRSRTILGSLARQCLSYFPEKNDTFKDDVQTLDLEGLGALMRPEHDDRPRYLLIDGLDECSIEERRSVLSHISWLQRQSNWRLGFSARLSADDFIGQHVALKWHICLPSSNPDIERYIDSELEARLANGELKIGDPNLIPEIRAALLSGANGMFLWVTLQLDQVCAEVSDHSIRLAIKSLPRDLSELYVRILKNSAAKDVRRYSVRVFKFLVAAYVPLNIDQIQEMASVTIGDTTWDPRKRINNILKVIGFCGSLVMIEEEEQTVRFVHHSARSFCQGVLKGSEQWDVCFSDEEAHQEMGETAVTYLSYGIFDTRISTQVTPKMDVGQTPERIIQQTLGASYPIARLALGLIMPNQESNRDIGQFMANIQDRGDSKTKLHPFLQYAKEFWILHTRNIKNSTVQELWARLFDEVNVHDLQFTPHILGPLDDFRVAREHPLASAFLWAVNYSHVSVFERLINMSDNRPFSTKLPWARFRFFRSLLRHLQPQDSLATTPCLEARMIQRLFPLAVVLRVHRAVQWMLPYVDRKEIPGAFEVAVSCGNYTSAAVISTNLAFRHHDGIAVPTELLPIAVSSHNAQMISLLVRMGAARSADANTLALSSLLYSDIHHAPLLSIIFMLSNAGIRPAALSSHQISATLQLLILSPEMSTKRASEAVKKILAADSDFPRLHQRIMSQACSVGSFELANAVWFSHQHIVREASESAWRRTPILPDFPFRGDELALALQTVSKSRVMLANWLVQKGAYSDDQQIYRRAIMLRNWQLVQTLLAKTKSPKDILNFCTNHELLHNCVYGGDSIGISFLLKIGMDLKAPSTGPMFRHKTSIDALLSRSSEYFNQLSIAELIIPDQNDACIQAPHGFAVLEQCMKRLISPENHLIWEFQVDAMMQTKLKSVIGSDARGYYWLICVLAAAVRKTVRVYFAPLNGNVKLGLSHLQKSLNLMEEIARSEMSPRSRRFCYEQQVIIAIREIFGVIADMDKFSVADESMSISEPRSRWHAQAMVWKFVDLLVAQQPIGRRPDKHSPRAKALKTLASLLSKRSLESVFPADPEDPSGSSDIQGRVYEVLCLADRSQSLAWTLQYLVLRSQKFSLQDFCDFLKGGKHSVRHINISRDTKHAFGLMGWTEEDIIMLEGRRP